MGMNPFVTVRQFEQAVAEYTGAPYAVSIDSCTGALFLACTYLRVKEVTIPARTYVSVPCSIIHAGGKVVMEDKTWSGAYQLEPYPIWDCACRFTSGMYVPGTYQCLSFQYKKHLPIGRGGMILTDDAKAVEWFKLARFHGRHEVPLMEDTPAMVGWHLYMEPERASRGLTLLSSIAKDNDDLYFDYPDIRTFNLYDNPERFYGL